MNMTLLLLFADTSAIGRFDSACLSEQDRMELIVTAFADLTSFQNEDGIFLPVEKWYGVETGESGKIITISWLTRSAYPRRFAGLWAGRAVETHGLQVGGSINVDFLPECLQNFRASALQLKGTINTSLLPRTLARLTCDGNRLHGTFEISGLPAEMIFIDIQRNHFFGTLDFSSMPRKLDSFSANENSFSGSVDFAALPACMTYLDLRNNALEGSVHLGNIDRDFVYFDIWGNNFVSPGGAPESPKPSNDTMDENMKGFLADV